MTGQPSPSNLPPRRNKGPIEGGIGWLAIAMGKYGLIFFGDEIPTHLDRFYINPLAIWRDDLKWDPFFAGKSDLLLKSIALEIFHKK